MLRPLNYDIDSDDKEHRQRRNKEKEMGSAFVRPGLVSNPDVQAARVRFRRQATPNVQVSVAWPVMTQHVPCALEGQAGHSHSRTSRFRSCIYYLFLSSLS